MKKGIALLLILVVIFAQAVPAAAEEVAQITIAASREAAKPGDEIVFTVSISGGESCRYYGLMLDYDPAVYEMGNGKCTVSGAMLSSFDPDRGFVVLNDKERVPQGVLGTFTMKVREDASAGNTLVTGISAMKSGDEEKPSAVTGANVEIQTESSTEETNPTQQTKPSGSQQSKPSGSQQSKSSDSQKNKAPKIEKPVFSVQEETKSLELTEDRNAETLVGEESTEIVTVPQEAAVSEEKIGQTMENRESGSSLVPAIALGAAILCVLFAVVLILKLRKR